jgi:hypothetical protein
MITMEQYSGDLRDQSIFNNVGCWTPPSIGSDRGDDAVRKVIAADSEDANNETRAPYFSLDLSFTGFLI